MLMKMLKATGSVLLVLLAAGCATHKQAPYDYTAFKASQPRSILVLPPLNNSPDVKATYSMYAQVTRPLAEAGYYVLPVALVSETFKQNGLTGAADIHAVGVDKLKSIFGADAALYVTITNYGSTYVVLNSVTKVSANASLVDLKTGALLWTGTATAVNDGGNNSGGGLVGALVAAAVKQIINSATDAAYPVAGLASASLLSGGLHNGILYGPRSAHYLQK